MLNVEKLKFEFYHIHWKMIDVYNFESANLKRKLCLTFPCETILAKVNLDNRSSLGYVKHILISKRIVIIVQSCLSNTQLWSKIYATRGVQFYHKRTLNTLSSFVYAYRINWASILKFLYFYRDVYVRKKGQILSLSVYLNILIESCHYCENLLQLTKVDIKHLNKFWFSHDMAQYSL